MLKHLDWRFRRVVALAVLGVASVTAAPRASAISYESSIGALEDLDMGNDVKRFDGCIQGGGSIIVGTRSSDKTNGRLAEIAMVNAGGSVVWQRDYLIDNGTSSTGEAIIAVPASGDLPEGFAITGIAIAAKQRAYVLRIDCKGKVLWAKILGNRTIAGRGAGYDLTLMTTNLGVAEGIIVVGDEAYDDPINPSLKRSYGRVARLGLDGVIAWERALDREDDSLGIRLRAVAVSPVDDEMGIIVAGSTSMRSTWSTDRRAFVSRMTAGATPTTSCGTYFGRQDATNDDYLGIVPTGLRVVVVGASQSLAMTSRQALLSVVNGGTCVLSVNRAWSAGLDGIDGEDIVVTLTPGGSPDGIAIAGSLYDAGGATTGHISKVNPATLAPEVAPVQQRFGALDPARERLRGIDAFGPRLLAAGSRVDAAVPSQSNLYLVATNTTFATTCSVDLPLDSIDPDYEQVDFLKQPLEVPLGEDVAVTVVENDRKGNHCCLPAGG